MKWFKSKTPKRITLKDVKVGEYIRIEWSKIQGGMGYLQCKSNDSKTQKILLEAKWVDVKGNQISKEQIVFDYWSDVFKNFYLLNHQDKIIEESHDLPTLENKLKEAIKKEEYEIASLLRKKIEKIKNK